MDEGRTRERDEMKFIRISTECKTLKGTISTVLFSVYYCYYLIFLNDWKILKYILVREIARKIFYKTLGG